MLRETLAKTTQWAKAKLGRAPAAPARAPRPLTEVDIKAMIQSGFKAINPADYFGSTVEFTALESYESILRLCCSKVWASWKACDLVSQEVMRTPFKVRRNRSETEVTVPGLATLLQYPNQRMTFAELLYLTTMHIKLVGNAYWYKRGARLDGSRPDELIPINPARVKIQTDRKTGDVIGYTVTAFVDGVMGTAPFDAEEILHFKRPHPNHDYYGIGDVEAGASLVGDAVNAAQSQERAWKNGNMPSGLLVKKTEYPTDPVEWARLKAQWDSQYGGTKNAGKIGWLGGDWTFIRTGLTPAELQRMEASSLTKEDIFALHGVPLSVAGVKDAANYATAATDDARFRAYAVAPMVKIVQDTMNTDLVTDWGDGLNIDFAVTGLINIGPTLEAVLPAFDRGIVSINEVRQMIGLKTEPDNPLWNDHYINAGLTPLTLAGIANADTTADVAKAIVQRNVMQTLNNGKPQS